MPLQLNINRKTVGIDADPDMPLLWVLRDMLGMTGTKFGCGAGLCGACTVIVGGEAVRSCSTTVGSVAGKPIRTIEGLADARTSKLHPVQQAWKDCNVAQCGYCQSGQIMSAVALLEKHPKPSAAQIAEGMEGNLCRCGTYPRMRQAIQMAAGKGKA
ncbi:(2Fe-2S)-binding protein [Massilia endophytica]|uniref:(2Fe-2S)-binding protein n=1 Tax=Massilia endophytica TaxID=2899220 RepID=UPI001E3432D4|nr:(2Fe-2S)-binding protein [Massilia endophytica]UGQ45841.1 (2Fe-2S)-binding protein [Massilia endophytica]